MNLLANIINKMDYKKYFEKNKVELSDKQLVAIKLGGMITAARLHSRLSQAELAKKIGTQQPSLARAEKGEVTPSVEFLYKIAKALKTEFVFPRFGFMGERPRTASSYYGVNERGEITETTSGGFFHHTPVQLENKTHLIFSLDKQSIRTINN